MLRIAPYTGQIFVALFAGFVFGVGLIVSGMTDPNKVIGFLDFAGNWNPQLVFVLGGAMFPNLLLFGWILKRKTPLLDDKFHLPESNTAITPQLVLGSVLFGIGWGLAGYCPGPAVVAIANGTASILYFVVPMVIGATAYKKLTAH